jgi:hypothetical protein
MAFEEFEKLQGSHIASTFTATALILLVSLQQRGDFLSGKTPPGKPSPLGSSASNRKRHAQKGNRSISCMLRCGVLRFLLNRDRCCGVFFSCCSTLCCQDGTPGQYELDEHEDEEWDQHCQSTDIIAERPGVVTFQQDSQRLHSQCQPCKDDRGNRAVETIAANHQP